MLAYEGAAADSGFDQPAPMRLIVRPGDGGEIDTQPGRELPMGRQALPGAQPAGLDVPGDRLGDIEVDRTLAACRQGGQPRLWLFFGILLQSELVSRSEEHTLNSSN